MQNFPICWVLQKPLDAVVAKIYPPVHDFPKNHLEAGNLNSSLLGAKITLFVAPMKFICRVFADVFFHFFAHEGGQVETHFVG